jgi:hypothetical protein
MSKPQDLSGHLARQLSFLSRSCQGYDAGFSDEAVRIAVVLRVLFHDTKRSKSLLRQMRRRDIHLISTCPPLTPNLVYFQGLGQTKVHASYSASTVEFVPDLGPYKDARLMPLDEWWQQVIMISDGKSVRRVQLILSAANQDGGAHVDPELSPEYERLATAGALGHYSIKDSQGLRAGPIIDAHFVFLRQIGQEVLLSNDLRCLTGNETAV